MTELPIDDTGPKYGFGKWLDDNKQKIVRFLVKDYLAEWLPLRKQDLPHIYPLEESDEYLTYRVETYSGRQYTVVLQRIDYDRHTTLDDPDNI